MKQFSKNVLKNKKEKKKTSLKMSATMVDRRRKFWNQLDFTYSNLSLLDFQGGGSETVLNTLAHD